MDIQVPDQDRPMHVYMPGKTQHGKSTLMFWMILQDITRDHGVCLMDGKGDFAPNLVNYVPESRIDDTLYLDINTPVPLDFMSYNDNDEKEALIGELKYILLKTVETQHIPIIGSNLTDILLTLFNYNEHSETPPECRATFLDIHYFLDDPERKKVILSRVNDEDLQRRWKNDWPSPQDAARIKTRTAPFVRSPTLKKIFGGKTPKLNIAQAMDGKKIIIVNLGPMDDIRRMYGTLLLSKIRQAANRRATILKSQRIPFYLYCDEFHEFQTPEFSKMLSLAGGLGLCLTLAHQYTDQLEAGILQGILGNVSSFICFRLGQASANCLRGEIPKQFLELLPTLPVGQAIYRAASGATNLIHTPAPPNFTRASYAEIIKKRTMDNYACDTPQVCSTEGDEHHTPRSDEINPSGTPRVSSHGGKKKNP